MEDCIILGLVLHTKHKSVWQAVILARNRVCRLPGYLAVHLWLSYFFKGSLDEHQIPWPRGFSRCFSQSKALGHTGWSISLATHPGDSMPLQLRRLFSPGSVTWLSLLALSARSNSLYFLPQSQPLRGASGAVSLQILTRQSVPGNPSPSPIPWSS